MENSFFVDSEKLSPQASCQEASAGDGSFIQTRSHGIPSGNGKDRIRRNGKGHVPYGLI